MYRYVVGTGLPNYPVLQGDYVATKFREKGIQFYNFEYQRVIHLFLDRSGLSPTSVEIFFGCQIPKRRHRLRIVPVDTLRFT